MRASTMMRWWSNLLVLLTLRAGASHALSVRSTVFLGQELRRPHPPQTAAPAADGGGSGRTLSMRKQKASDRRTRRLQRGLDSGEGISAILTVTESPMKAAGPWRGKTLQPTYKDATLTHSAVSATAKSGGRGRSRKRSTLYHSLSQYHNHFLRLLTLEYQFEEEEVLGRIKNSIDDPMALEKAGHAIFDIFPSRRGNLFSDEVYRLCKAQDATSVYSRSITDGDAAPMSSASAPYMPPNHKFAKNDVIMLTLQPNGSGDFFNPASLPTNTEQAVSAEARVLNTGPTYVDVALSAGAFEAAFGPAPNDRHATAAAGGGDSTMRLRADRFISKVPYLRMVQALSQITAIPSRQSKTRTVSRESSLETSTEADVVRSHDAIVMDEVIRGAILTTYAYTDPQSPLFRDSGTCNLQEVADKLSKPPMRTSQKLAANTMRFIQAKPEIFPSFNAPQRAAIEAALSRRMTMIQGPPGSGKTTVAAAIGFGFASQCRAISSHTKVLACAFSNVGADNLAEAMLGLGLKVIRVGKPSAIAENLWNFTLEAAVHRDPEASKALADAARATAQLAKLNKRVKTSLGERAIREAATTAVKDSIRKCNVAATKALREVDIVVSTSSGAADHRLLAACGMVFDDSGASKGQASMERDPSRPIRELAPDGLPPLSLPFVLVDEACQSVEPATLIPIVSSNSCRSLVLLGDPCQLPPTVRSRQADPLSLSLMERLSVALPKPIVSTQVDNTMNDSSYLQSLAIRQSKSLLRFMDNQSAGDQAYRKRFAGSLLLSVQYRMHPSIAAFPSVVFYDGLLSTPVSLSMTSLRAFPSSLGHLMPGGDAMQCLRVINVGGRNNERRGNSGGDVSSVFSGVGIPSILEESTSYWNVAEALQVVSLLKVILRGDDSNVQTVGVISPYNGQVQLIKQMIASDIELRGLVSNGKRPLSIEVKSVDGYQGRERDVILFSAVRSNRQGRIGFLHDWRRMNVAMTRAKSAFLFVGDLATLSDADKHWAAFIKYASGLRIIINDMGSVEEKQTL